MGEKMVARTQRYLDFIAGGEDALVEIIGSICERRVYLPAFCQERQISYGEVMNWLMADDVRYERYMRALEADAHSLMTETVAIADEQKEAVSKDGNKFDPDVARDRLRIDARQKLARSHYRKLYGDQAADVKGVAVPVFQVVVADGGVVNVGVSGPEKGAVIDIMPGAAKAEIPEDI